MDHIVEPGFDSGGFQFFDLFPVFFVIIFVIVIGAFLTIAIKGISQWRKNEQSPELTVPAVVKVKRSKVDRHHHHDNHVHGHQRTTYYVTFEFNSGDRKEFLLSGQEYGLLAEGDIGMLTFKGTRFLGFEREK